jgi:hypothetical protein
MRRRSVNTAFRMVLPLVLALSACATRTERIAVPPSNTGVAPALTVERFLRAVNARDYDTMARLFGTKSGSVLERDPKPEVERRMFALASVLRHDDYAIEDEMAAPGRTGEAVVIVVRLQVGDQRVPVPFTVVRTKNAGWLVENIDIVRITAGA